MDQPRILLVPTLCELEWRIKPDIASWAEVAFFDAPGVGAEKATAFSQRAVVERGLNEIDSKGWDSCVVVGDEFGCSTAVRIAADRPEAVEALALGHPTLSLRADGDRPPLNGEMLEAFMQVARTDYGSHVRSLSQITQHAYDDEFADAYRERVPPEVTEAYIDALFAADRDEPIGTVLRKLDIPMLFVQHDGCLLYTSEGYEDAAAEFTAAMTASMEVKPSANPEFADVLRNFCEGLAEPNDARAAGRAS